MKILVADDERDVLEFVKFVFKQEGHEVFTAADGAAALQLFNVKQPDLVILDLTMPRLNGLQVLDEIRRQGSTPVIMLTVRSAEDDIVKALSRGADDYIVKGFRPRELRARADAVMRRARPAAHSKQDEPLTFGKLRLSPQSHQVTLDGSSVHLTPIEFTLLHYLMLNHDMVLNPQQIIANIWNFSEEGNADMVRVNVSRLRHKIEPDPVRPIYIINIAGVGYVFRSQPIEPGTSPTLLEDESDVAAD